MPNFFDWSEAIAQLPGKPVPTAWLDTKGKDVKVAFADTGVNVDLAPLNHLNKPGRRFFTGAPGFSPAKIVGNDPVFDSFGAADRGHGTKYASLIAGKKLDDPNAPADVVAGMANEASYFIIKTRDKTDKKTTIKNLLDALELSANLGIEVFITGQNIRLSELEDEGLELSDVDRVFNLPGVQKMFIFAPLENRASGESWEKICEDYFPSFKEEVFNIAELPEDLNDISDIIKTQPIPFLLAGFTGKLLAKNGVATEISSFSNSGAVTIAGGLATLALSFFKQQNAGALPTLAQMKELLGSCFRPLSDASGLFQSPACFKNF